MAYKKLQHLNKSHELNTTHYLIMVNILAIYILDKFPVLPSNVDRLFDLYLQYGDR